MTALLGNAFLVQSVDSAFRADETIPLQFRNVGALLWEPPSELERELADAVLAARRDRREVVFVQMARSFNQKRLWPLLVSALGREPAMEPPFTSSISSDQANRGKRLPQEARRHYSAESQRRKRRFQDLQRSLTRNEP